MKKLLFLFLFLTYFTTSKSQTVSNIQNEFSSLLNYVKMNRYNISPKIVGDLYVNNEWCSGQIHSNVFKPFPKEAKYNFFAYSEEIHVINNDDTLSIQLNPSIDSVTFNNQTFIPAYYQIDNKFKQSYFQKLNNGRIKLLKRYTCFFIKSNQNTTSGYEKVKPDRYEKKSAYYYLHKNMIAQPLRKRKSSLIEIFPDHKKEIKVYLKKNKVKSEKQLTKLFTYYNSLR